MKAGNLGKPGQQNYLHPKTNNIYVRGIVNKSYILTRSTFDIIAMDSEENHGGNSTETTESTKSIKILHN